jgi:dolichol-phosphate mannosyltransferase
MIPRLQLLQRPLRFGLVGLSGVVVNTAILWALVEGVRLPVLLASVLATEMAILSNFMLNDRWTFRAATRRHSFVQRLLRFNGVALGGMTISTATLAMLTTYGSLHLLLANLFAVGAALVWNYGVNSRWTWRGQSAVANQQSPVVTLAPADCRLPTADRNLKEMTA